MFLSCLNSTLDLGTIVFTVVVLFILLRVRDEDDIITTKFFSGYDKALRPDFGEQLRIILR